MDPQLQQPENTKRNYHCVNSFPWRGREDISSDRKDPNRPSNINLRMMHGVNKLSIIIFLCRDLYDHQALVSVNIESFRAYCLAKPGADDLPIWP